MNQMKSILDSMEYSISDEFKTRLLQGQRIRLSELNPLKIKLEVIDSRKYIFCDNNDKVFALGKVNCDQKGYHLSLSRSLL